MSLIDEKDLPENWQDQIVERPPVSVTGAPPPNQNLSGANKYESGAMPPILGLAPDLVRTQIAGRGPVHRLMPSPSAGLAQSNSATGGNVNTNQSVLAAEKSAAAAGTQAANAQAGVVALQAVSFQGAYNLSFTYSKGSSVDSGGIIYFSLQNGNLNHTPATSPTFWQAAGTETFAGVWSGATAYTIGQTVTEGSDLFIALQNSTGQDPASTTGFWQLLSGAVGFEGNYVAANSFNIGAEVLYNSSYWLAVASVPPGNIPATGSSFWVNVGSTALVNGQNFLANPGFEINTVGTPVNGYGSTILAGGSVGNGWQVNDVAGPLLVAYETNSQAKSGLSNSLIRVSSSFSVPATTTYESRILSTPLVAVAPGNSIFYSGFASWNFNTGIPAGLTIIQRVGILVYAGDGVTQLTEQSAQFSNNQTNAYNLLSGTYLVPATVGGGSPAFVRMQVSGFVINATGSPISTPAGLCADLRFDDCTLLVQANMDTATIDGTSRFGQTASGLSYRPLSNPLTGHDAGANATINIASFTMRTSSKGDISDSSGSITALSYGTGYFIYYDDPNLAGGAVVYNATTTKGTALNGAGRFYVGSITTPLAGAIDTIGSNDGGTGAQSGSTLLVISTAQSPNGTSGYGLLTPTSATNTTSNAGATEEQWLGYVPQSQGAPSAITISVTSQVTVSGAGTGNAILRYSTDGGSTFTTIYNTSVNRALTTDVTNVTLPANVQKIVISAQNSHTGGAGSSTHTLSGIQVQVQI